MFKAVFQLYNQRYFQERLRSMPIYVRHNKRIVSLGWFCKFHESITINLAHHTSDADVRSTLLHEMCHVAAGPRSKGHDSLFFNELERVLAQRAPIIVTPDDNEWRSLDAVPARFRRCRAALARAERTARRPHYLKRGNVYGPVIHDFTFEAARGRSWQDALKFLGDAYGLLDIDGNVLRHRREFVKVGRAAYLACRRGTPVVL